ncbi:MAG: hypothetical protein JW734_05230 [Candidatus Omnitrophica bacterium]|nr:hypothetical protein [Candidatus Omnitrophota bacterium]
MSSSARQIVIAVLAGLFFSGFLSFSVFSQEEITITTYYPAPFGVYSELRLYPKPSASAVCDASMEGTLYFNDGTGLNGLADYGIRVCKGPAPDWGWKAIGGIWVMNAQNDIYPAGNVRNVLIGRSTAPASPNPADYDLYVEGTVYANGND